MSAGAPIDPPGSGGSARAVDLPPAGGPDAEQRSTRRPQGLVLEPFRALRYTAPSLAGLTSPPYDVLDEQAVTELEAAAEHNVVRLIQPRAGAPDVDRYQQAARTLRDWRARGVLAADPRAGLYVYEQAGPQGHVQRGLLGRLALTPPEDGIVLPHENTMAGPVRDRLALYTAVQADLEPIFLVYEGGGAASRAVADVAGEPLVDAVLEDGLRHRLWAVTDEGRLRAIAADLAGRRAVIADGHHRYATYLQRQAQHAGSGGGPGPTGGPTDFGLAFLVDAQAFGPQVHAIHRVLPGRDVDDLAAAAAAAGVAVRHLDGDPLDALAALGTVAGPAFLLADGHGRRLRLLSRLDPAGLARALPDDRSAAWRDLDVTALHRFLVPEVWRLDDTVETVRYEHDVPAALATARRTGGTAVLLKPTPVASVAAVAAAGERMPRKSTLFTPKPRSGVVLRDHVDG